MKRRRIFRVTIEVEVHDARSVKSLATDRAIKDGLTKAEWRRQRHSTSDDLQMLLDPGLIGYGADVLHSKCEEIR